MLPFNRLQVAVEIGLGTEVFFQPPQMAECGPSDFWDRYRNQKAIVIGFGVHYVGPLDWLGWEPGAYHHQGEVKVRFADGSEHSLNSYHFKLIGPGKLVPCTEFPEERSWGETNIRIGDLPEPIQFYPDDLVIVQGEQESRAVADLSFDKSGAITYLLAPSEREQEEREQEKRKLRPALRIVNSYIPNLRKAANDLELLKEGNVRRLYRGQPPIFKEPQEAIAFWKQSGLSKPVESLLPHGEKTLERLLNGEGDLLTCSHSEAARQKHPAMAHQCCASRRLHARWAKYRPLVRELAKHYRAAATAEV